MPGQSRMVKVLFFDKSIGSNVLRHYPVEMYIFDKSEEGKIREEWKKERKKE